MNGAQRRAKIIEYIKSEQGPVSGKQLAELFDVSRQIIVQDIALIRANGCEIFSTNRGYVLHTKKVASRVVSVNHTDDELEAELCTIVDMGGKVVNVMVNHKLYGEITADLNIASRHKVQEFISDMKTGKSSPLKNITANEHKHLIEAEDEETLDMIEEKLGEMGFLL